MNEIRIIIGADQRSDAAFRAANANVDRLDRNLTDAERSMRNLGDRSERSMQDLTRGAGRAERSVQDLGQRSERSMTDLTHGADHAEHSVHDLGQRSEQSMREIQQAAERASHSVQEVGDAGHGSGGALNSLREQASGALDGVMEHAGGAGQALQALGPYGKAAAVVVGAAFGAAALAIKGFEAAMDASLQRATDLGRMKAQLLLSPKEAAADAKVAAKVYTDNWGSSLEDAADYVRTAALYIMPTANQMKGAITPSLDVVAERVAALASTMDEDSSAVARAIKQMLVTGMASSVDEAFNLIHAGIAKGANAADDLLDTMNEYGTQFRKMGIDGKTAIGLLSQGLQGGARDADLVADAIKEFSIRSIDGSTGTVDAFKSLKLNAKEMQAQFAKGGPAAEAGLQKVLDLLRGIKDPAEQARIATELFGTQSEDLGKALYALDPKSAAAGLGDIAHAADIAGAHMSGNAYSAVEAYKRKWEMFKADVGDKIAPMFQKAVTWASALADKLTPFVQYVLADMKKAWTDNKDEIEKFGKFCEQVLVPFLGGVLVVAIGAIDFAFRGVVSAMGTVGDAFEEFKREGSAIALFLVNKVFGPMVDSAAYAFGWIPGLGPKLKKAQADFAEFRDNVNVALGGIKDKEVNIRISQSGMAPVTAQGAKTTSTHRAMPTGGIGGGLPTMVGDVWGPEMIDWTAGRVYNFQQTRRAVGAMAGGGSSGGSGSFSVGVIAGAGSELAAFLLKILRFEIQTAGGNVQTVLGS